MSNPNTAAKTSLVLDIWASFMAMPLWVRIWMALILVPVNMAGLFFLDQPGAVLVTVLSLMGMLPNLPIMAINRGFSSAMALPHLPFWTALVLILLFQRPEGGTASYQMLLTVILVVDVISLAFDYKDAWAWWRGERAVAGR